MNPWKFLIPTKINDQTIQYDILHNNIYTNIPYKWPALATSWLNTGYISSYALVYVSGQSLSYNKIPFYNNLIEAFIITKPILVHS